MFSTVYNGKYLKERLSSAKNKYKSSPIDPPTSFSSTVSTVVFIKLARTVPKESVYIIALPCFLFLWLQVCQFAAEETLRSPIFLI